jgi:hypothetical protein
MALEYLNLLIPVPRPYIMRFNPQQAPLSYQNKRTLLPGKSSKIEVKYNMAVGPIRKTITVESNAVMIGGRVPLKIKGEVTDN